MLFTTALLKMGEESYPRDKTAEPQNYYNKMIDIINVHNIC